MRNHWNWCYHVLPYFRFQTRPTQLTFHSHKLSILDLTQRVHTFRPELFEKIFGWGQGTWGLIVLNMF